MSAALVLALLTQVSADQLPSVVADGRDFATLLDGHLANRELVDQLGHTTQTRRLQPMLDGAQERRRFVIAADASVGSQQVAGSALQSRFHGFYFIDTFVGVRALPSLDLNVNVRALNPSASDGFRLSEEISAGAALHFHPTFELAPGHTARLDLVAIDVAEVTHGEGLLVERADLEGAIASVSLDGLTFRHTFGGRGFWDDDDLLAFTLEAFDGRLAASALHWQFTSAPAATYYSLSGHQRFFDDHLRFGAEASARTLDGAWRVGALGRVDLLGELTPGLRAHVGYQARAYQQGFTPRLDGTSPTIIHNTPVREDRYVTNPFEFYGPGADFDQWSHTALGEVLWRFHPNLRVVLEGELFAHFADGEAGVTPTEDGDLFPGVALRPYYRAALQWFPWEYYPHRLLLGVTNKQVRTGFVVAQPTFGRFAPREPYLLLQVETFL